MISYKEWKQNKIEEASASPDIDSLVQQTTDDIASEIEAFISNMGKPTAAPAQAAPSQPAGPSLGQRVAQQAKDYFNTPVKGGVTRGQDIQNRHPWLKSLIHGSGTLPQNASWKDKIKDRIKSLVGWMKKEDFSPDDVISTNDLQEWLSESGLKRLFLIEANQDFGNLKNRIHAHVKNLVAKIQGSSGSSPVPGQKIPLSNPQNIHGQNLDTDNRGWPKGTGSWEDIDILQAAKDAVVGKGNGKSALERFMNNAKRQGEDPRQALEELGKSLNASPQQVRAWISKAGKDKEFAGTLIQKLKSLISQAQAPEAAQEVPPQDVKKKSNPKATPKNNRKVAKPQRKKK
jgi:hypothetical protein